MPPAPSSPDPEKLEPELRPHYVAYLRSPTPRAASTLLKHTNSIIDTGVKAFGGPDNPMVRSRAKKLALDSFASYDPRRASLKTHMLNHLQGLQRYAAKQTRMISVPERVAIDRRHLDRHEAELRDELGREPSSAELGDRSGLSIKRQELVRSYRPGFAEGQATAARPGDADGSGNDPTVQSGPDIAGRLLYLYHDLDPTDQAIVEHGFGLHGRTPLRVGQLAQKLNLSPGRISQRAARIQQKLDELDDTGIF